MTTYLITGASSGIGEEMAKLAVKRGATVYGLARSEDKLNEMAETLGERFLPFVCDVTDKAAVMKTCEALPALPDIALLNAGIGDFESTRNFDIAIHEKTFAINYFGVLNFVHALAPKMMARKRGVFAVTSSLAGYRGLPRASAYSASKAAISAAFEGAEMTLHKTGIKFINIHPGFVETPLTADAKHPMPFLWTADKAAKYILNGIEKEKTHINFPIMVHIGVTLGRLLPACLYRRMMRV